VSGININDLRRPQTTTAGTPKPGGKSLRDLLETDISIFPVKFTDKTKEEFYLELSTLLTSGLDMKSALELLEAEQDKPQRAAIMRNIKDNLVNGDMLWEAMQRTGEFTPYEYFSIQIGEETGRIGEVLNQLYQFYHSKLKQRRQFIGALSYPVIILLTSIGAVAFMLLFIVPMFNDIFKRFGGELPYMTRIIINFSGFIKSYILLVIALFGGTGYILYRNREKPGMRKFSSQVIRRIPVIGRIIYAVQLARFCSSMALLLGSKVPIIRSINLVSQMITFYPIQITLESMAADILNGVSLHESMSHFPVYSRKMVSLLKVGEEVNKLDVFFEKLSQQFSSDVEHQTGLLNTFLEPVMIIFLGLVVGFILLAMYLPMFQVSTSIGG
jgi:type IV pilus assembly protein PilC